MQVGGRRWMTNLPRREQRLSWPEIGDPLRTPVSSSVPDIAASAAQERTGRRSRGCCAPPLMLAREQARGPPLMLAREQARGRALMLARHGR